MKIFQTAQNDYDIVNLKSLNNKLSGIFGG